MFENWGIDEGFISCRYMWFGDGFEYSWGHCLPSTATYYSVGLGEAGSEFHLDCLSENLLTGLRTKCVCSAFNFRVRSRDSLEPWKKVLLCRVIATSGLSDMNLFG